MAKKTDDSLASLGRFSEPALHILIALADGPKHGYAMTQDIEAMTANLLGTLRDMGDDLSAAADMLDALCTMNATLDGLLTSTDELLQEIMGSLEPRDYLVGGGDRVGSSQALTGGFRPRGWWL